MVKKSLFRGLLLTNFLAVLSTAHAMNNNNNNIEEKNIENNRNFLYVTAKQLKKGFKEGSIDIEGKKFSVESLSKPNFDLIALAKNIQGIKKEEGVFNFYYKKKNEVEVFNLNLKFQETVPTQDTVLLDKKNISTISLDTNFSLVCSPKKNLQEEIVSSPIPFYLQKNGNFVKTLRKERGGEIITPLTIPSVISNKIFQYMRKIDCFLHLAKPHYNYKKQKNVVPVFSDGISLFHMMVRHPSMINIILKDEKYAIAREKIARSIEVDSDFLKSLDDQYHGNYLTNALEILKAFPPKKLWLEWTSDRIGYLFSEVIKDNNSLTQLHIFKIKSQGFTNICEALTKSTNLQRVEIDGQTENHKDFDKIGDVLQNSNNLKSLRIIACSLNSENAIHIWRSLKNKSKLNTLSFTGNPISDEGIQEMCDDLKNNKQLKLSVLSLYGTSLKVQGFNFICEALTTNKSIIDLNLGANESDIKGFEVLSKGLEINKSLTKLDLTSTGLNNEKIKILSEGLKVNKGLTHLYLGEYGHEIDNEGVNHLLDVLKMNKTLEMIDINSSYIDKDLMLKLKMALKENRNKK